MRAVSSPDNGARRGFCVPKGAGDTQGAFQSTKWGQPGPRKGLEKSNLLNPLDTAPPSAATPRHPAAGKVQVMASLSPHPQLQALHQCLVKKIKMMDSLMLDKTSEITKSSFHSHPRPGMWDQSINSPQTASETKRCLRGRERRKSCHCKALKSNQNPACGWKIQDTGTWVWPFERKEYWMEWRNWEYCME